MSKEKTEDQVRDEFLAHVRHLVQYWNRQSTNTEGKLNGLAFSILAAIDGCSAGLTGFILAPCPHPDDKQFHIDEGEDYYPENHDSDVKCDIAGNLHDSFYQN